MARLNVYGEGGLDEYARRQAITWACSVLRTAGWRLEYVGPGDVWDVLTPDGWDGANSWQELCKIAERVGRR